MGSVDLYKLIGSFYSIRGDNYARDYIQFFVKKVMKCGVSVDDLGEWCVCNVDELGFEFGDVDVDSYKFVLAQFVKYVRVVGSGVVVSSGGGVRSRRGKIKIYDTFYELQCASDDKIY